MSGSDPQDRVAIVQANLETLLATIPPAERKPRPEEPISEGSSLDVRTARDLYVRQLESRLLDVAARELKKFGQSYYTISSAGHEQNVVLGELLRTTDPCLLHYRSGALMMARLAKGGVESRLRDVLLSLAAKSDDPVCGGRHKVWGSRDLWVPPQTSTIASHLPKAVGISFALARARKLGVENGLPRDAIVCCSFGDASANHASALAGLNAARYAARQGHPAPILFVCEDNGRGISVETPTGWIAESYRNRSHLQYVRASGTLADIWDATAEAIRHCRASRSPVFLHLECVRLWGHAGSDVEATYLSRNEIEEAESQDPLLANAELLLRAGAARPGEIMEKIRGLADEIRSVAGEIVLRPHLSEREEIVAPIAPFDREKTAAAASGALDEKARSSIFPGGLPEKARGVKRRTMAAHINSALFDEMAKRPEAIVFGEDVGRKGGVYSITAGLQKAFGRARVFDTLLDETTILGIAQGAAQIGLLPIAEIQYLAYVHNAIDQLRGEACSQAFFSGGDWTNPMVVRIASLAYQKGFGGHFHNDNAIAALREIPGLAIAVPSRGDDAARLLRGATALARENERVVAFLEPIALYHEKDLHDEGDRGWLADYPVPGEALIPGEVRVDHPKETDLLVVSFANGLRLSLQAAKVLAEKHDVKARVLDLLWLNPLPHEAIARHAAECDAVLVVDECRATGAGVADAILADLAERGLARRTGTVRAADSYVPLGPSTAQILVTREQIVDAALALR